MAKPSTLPSPGRRRGPPPQNFGQRLEQTADLYLQDCYERRTAARCDDYARYLELTPSYLTRRTVAVLGKPPSDFLRERQLRYAERLLRTTSYSTVEIAAMSAFGSRPAFYRAFQAAYGMTPGQYRIRVRGMPHPSPRRRRGPPPQDFRLRLERSVDLYLRDCYARKSPARSAGYARHLDVTLQYLARRTRAIFGISPHAFLRDRQLRHAERLLRTTSYSTVQIAAMSAFGSYPALYRTFRAAHGMTPGEYRERGSKMPMVSQGG